jgi:hypothetical protein
MARITSFFMRGDRTRSVAATRTRGWAMATVAADSGSPTATGWVRR